MVSRKAPWSTGNNPGRDGFNRIPEPGGAGPRIRGGGRSRAAVEADLKKYGMDTASRKKKAAEATRNFYRDVEQLEGRDALKKLHASMTRKKREHKIERARDKAKRSKMH